MRFFFLPGIFQDFLFVFLNIVICWVVVSWTFILHSVFWASRICGLVSVINLEENSQSLLLQIFLMFLPLFFLISLSKAFISVTVLLIISISFHFLRVSFLSLPICSCMLSTFPIRALGILISYFKVPVRQFQNLCHIWLGVRLYLLYIATGSRG